jgi:hypothetical protein
MSDAADSIIRVMTEHEAPEGGWDMPGLRKLTGLSIGNFAAAVARLRAQGKIGAFSLSLVQTGTDAAQDAPAEIAPVPVSLAAQVKAEAIDAGKTRQSARVIGLNGGAGMPVSVGAQLQEKALDGAPMLAAGIVRDRWEPVWKRVCRHAQRTNQKPVAAMIALLAQALDAERGDVAA